MTTLTLNLDRPLTGRCWLAPFDPDPCCDGHLDPAHLLPKQLIRRRHVSVDPWDERLIVGACRLHHTRFDDGRLRIPRERLPAAFVRLLEELGLSWYLDRRYGPQTALARL